MILGYCVQYQSTILLMCQLINQYLSILQQDMFNLPVLFFIVLFPLGQLQVTQINYTSIPKYVTEIGGTLPTAIQYAQNYYMIEASKTFATILPDEMGLRTEMYAYSSIGPGGTKVDSPKIVVEKDQQVIISWINNIQGTPILPVDTTISPTIPVEIYSTQVPMIPHVHGVTATQGYDGRPNGWFTKSGIHGPDYFSAPNYMNNSATLIYQNQNIPGLYYFHDHSLSITRLNVVSGLKGVYEIITINQTEEQIKIRQAFGVMENVELVITDLRFQSNGSIYYHDRARVANYVYWIPGYYGDVMIVNGKSWPFFNVQNRRYRLKLMNTCNARFLNIYFEDSSGSNITFYIVKRDAGYLNQPQQKQEAMLIPFSRMEVAIDFSDAVGNVIMRNNANTIYPVGAPVDPNLDGQIMMFILSVNRENAIDPTLTNTYKMGFQYPTAASDPIIVPLSLHQISLTDGNVTKMLFNGQNMHNGKLCENRVFQRGQTYDLYVFNPTMDNHPIHIHLITMQTIGRYQLSDDFIGKFNEINNIFGGGLQTCAQFPQIQTYLIGDMIPATNQERSKRDIVDAFAGYVTVIRISITNQDLQILQQKFNGMFPIHCHMLEHQDNDMMTLFHVVNERKCFSQPSLRQNQDLFYVREVIACRDPEGLQVWIIVLIVVGGVLVGVLIYFLVKKLVIDKIKKNSSPQTSPVYLVEQKDKIQQINHSNSRKSSKSLGKQKKDQNTLSDLKNN